jgi:hypothetical protein
MTPETTAKLRAALRDALDRPDNEVEDAIIDGLRARGLILVEEKALVAVLGLARAIRGSVEPQVYPPRRKVVDALAPSPRGYEPMSYREDMIGAGRQHLLGDR